MESYKKRVNTYFIETKGSHEPGYIIPLLAHGGKSKFFPLPLYRFNDSGDGHSQFRDYAHAEGFLNEYDKLNNIALDALPGKVLSAPQKAIYKRMSVFSQCHKLYWEAQKFSASAEQAAISKQLFTHIVEWIGVADSAQVDIGRARVITMCWSVINGFLHHAKASSGGARSRTIGYGAMGGAAAYVLPELAGSKLECTELWDASGDGRAIKKPAFETLTKDDRILILPHRIEVENAVLMQAKPSGCQVFSHGQIINLLACERFPAVFDACRKMREVLQ